MIGHVDSMRVFGLYRDPAPFWIFGTAGHVTEWPFCDEVFGEIGFNVVTSGGPVYGR